VTASTHFQAEQAPKDEADGEIEVIWTREVVNGCE
jgi:hypothetical protein